MSRESIQDIVQKKIDKAPMYKILKGTIKGQIFTCKDGGEIDEVEEWQVNGLLPKTSEKKGILMISMDNKEKFFLPLGNEKIQNFEIIEVVSAIIKALSGSGNAYITDIITQFKLIETHYLEGL